jgi:hypothetical protein
MLDVRTVKVRLRDYGVIAHSQVTSLLMSGILAFAALSLLDILRTDDLRWMRLLLWAGGLAAETNVLVQQMQRPILATRAGGYEIAILTVRGVFALLIFALVAPQTGGLEGWKFSYLGGIVLLGSGALLRWHVNIQTEAERIDPALGPAVRAIRERNSKVGNVCVCIVDAGPGLVCDWDRHGGFRCYLDRDPDFPPECPPRFRDV